MVDSVIAVEGTLLGDSLENHFLVSWPVYLVEAPIASYIEHIPLSVLGLGDMWAVWNWWQE